MAVIYSFNSFIAPRNAKNKNMELWYVSTNYNTPFIASEVLCLFIVGVNNETIYEDIR